MTDPTDQIPLPATGPENDPETGPGSAPETGQAPVAPAASGVRVHHLVLGLTYLGIALWALLGSVVEVPLPRADVMFAGLLILAGTVGLAVSGRSVLSRRD